GVVQRSIDRGEWTEAHREGAFLYTIDTVADLDRKWPAIKADAPDFIKTYLLYSEEFAKRKDDPAAVNWRGLDPVVLAAIVRRAHADRLRVSTHIETAADFHNALMAGVDEINHMPGFRGNEKLAIPDPALFEITEADAREAARRGTFVVTTLGGV